VGYARPWSIPRREPGGRGIHDHQKLAAGAKDLNDFREKAPWPGGPHVPGQTANVIKGASHQRHLAVGVARLRGRHGIRAAKYGTMKARPNQSEPSLSLADKGLSAGPGRRRHCEHGAGRIQACPTAKIYLNNGNASRRASTGAQGPGESAGEIARHGAEVSTPDPPQKKKKKKKKKTT